MEILTRPFLGALLREYANKYEHPREKLIVLVHWAFLRRHFLILMDGENKDIMDWIKNENDSIDIAYFLNNLVIQTEQFFDNENFYIQLKMDENNQLFLQMSVNDYVNENDGSLKCINEFIVQIENKIDELSRRKQEIVNNMMKELKQQKKATLINQKKNDNQLEISSSFFG